MELPNPGMTVDARRTALVITDPMLLAELFLSLVLGRAARLRTYGIELPAEHLKARTAAAVALFMRALRP